ncbi:hypothetical protein SPRG_09177 [Saprolegnia parasitica CBS 223.65]|uniref:Uncharacterized protein n=1 Tax=Saprolegnia parasitica (strain CBS 223.65) TaxID=695850 RepID=A0A067CEV5_SAPPC|nr:hypothetical protein SPRG_09177 [Saprolegnia parasitica CBS 223.65]KDO25352.1 hypothetical protein SPRG_09177 [Saprolegnia parasitica CBS 223.65]|eukprot:XP_012204001.1 hypothetical protein SPRG_09177 [Saprolegnia parasitica CBS 223.65]
MQHVLLPTDPTARRTGIDWFSHRLFYNTDRMLAHTFFLSSSLRLQDHVQIDCGNDSVDISARLQVDIALPLEVTHSVLHDAIWSIMRGDGAPFLLAFLDQEMLSSS